MANQRRSYVDHVTCPICLDLLYNPRALPCMHTFCAECLSTYITSDCKTGDKKGFLCPVCKTFTKPPLKGMHPCSWAYNYSLNFALNGLVNEMKAKHRSLKAVSQGGTDTVSGSVSEAKCASHPDRAIEFECLDHYDTFCSVCAALLHRKCEQINFLGYIGDEGKKPRLNYKCMDDSSFNRKTHRSIMRLSKSFDENDQTIPKSIDPEVLASDFAHARSICEMPEMNHETFPKQIESRENTSEVTRKHFHYGEMSNKEEENERSVISARKSLSRLKINSEEKKVQIDDMFKPQTRVTYSRHDNNEKVQASPTLSEGSGIDARSQTVSSLNDIIEEDEDVVSVTVDETVSKSHLELKNKFYIRAQCDQKCCSITGMCVLPDGKVILADEANENVKLFDSNGLFEAYVKLETEPWDVTAIEQYEAAVSCPASKNIHIILTYDSLAITRTISLDKRCYGITYHSNEIYVAMENEIRIITYEGKVSQKICSESARKRLFTLPLSFPRTIFRSAKYVDLNTEQKNVKILVSDSSKNCVVSVSRHGKILSMLKLGNESVPYGVTFGNGNKFYVCTSPNMLLAINSDEHGNRIKKVLEMNATQAVHYHHISKSVWVSLKAFNFVMVYAVRKDNTP